MTRVIISALKISAVRSHSYYWNLSHNDNIRRSSASLNHVGVLCLIRPRDFRAVELYSFVVFFHVLMNLNAHNHVC